MDQDYTRLNDLQIDALREIGNIGSGNAATALSAMLDRKVDMTVPHVSILDYNDVIRNLGGPEQLLVGLLFSLSGEVSGMIMFLLNKDFAHMVLNALMGTGMNERGELDEMSESAIQEVGNIMAASYINAIAALTDLEIGITVPDLCVDMAGAILSVPAIYYADISDKIIFIEDEFSNMDERAATHVLLIPETDGLQKIMNSLGLDL